MNHFKTGILTLAVALTGALSATAQTADEVIDKHIKAIGGLENWKKINTVTMHAVATQGGTEIPINITTQQGKGMKVDYTFNGMTGWSILTDKAGWSYSPFGGQAKADALPEDAVKQSQDQLDVQGALVDYKAKGNKVTYLGKDEDEGTECYKLKVIYPSGKEETMFIDATNYYHIKSKIKIKANGQENEATASFGDFQKQTESGIVFPMSQDGMGGQMKIKSVEINKPIAANLFVPTEETKAGDTKK